MSILARTFTREVTFVEMASATDCTSTSAPSTRRRTWSLSCFGSRWMSLARWATASFTSSLRRTTASPDTGSRLAAGIPASVSHSLFSSYVFGVEGGGTHVADHALATLRLAGEAAPAAVEDEDVPR